METNHTKQRFFLDKWAWSPEHGELCQVIESQTLWGETVCRVWLSGKDTVVRLPAARIRPIYAGQYRLGQREIQSTPLYLLRQNRREEMPADKRIRAQAAKEKIKGPLSKIQEDAQ